MNQPRPPQPGSPLSGSNPTGPPKPSSTPSPGEIANRLDGQRGWLNELDRSLKKRSIIVLVLTCLAIGAGAAAIYISVTKNSDSDRIDALETRIENLEAAAGVAAESGSTVPPPVVPEDSSAESGVTLPDTVVPGGITGSGTTTPLPPNP